jgi:hypothetical protein
MSTLIEDQVLPTLLSFYDVTKTLSLDALGDEQAWVFDLGGALAPLPGVNTHEVKAGAPMLRVIGVFDIEDRAKVSAGWVKMNEVLASSMKANPLLFGTQPLEPDMERRFGFMNYFYALPLPSADLYPCIAINDHSLVLGSSRSLNEETASHLLHVKPNTEPAALRWRLSLAKVRAVMKTFSPLLPKPKAKGEIKSISQWLAPFEDLTGRAWVEQGSVRTTTMWDMHDVVKYE